MSFSAKNSNTILEEDECAATLPSDEDLSTSSVSTNSNFENGNVIFMETIPNYQVCSDI